MGLYCGPYFGPAFPAPRRRRAGGGRFSSRPVVAAWPVAVARLAAAVGVPVSRDIHLVDLD